MNEGFIGYAEDGGTILEYWQCHGEGQVASCYEEWACLDPEEGCDLCLRRCDICGGNGSYVVPPKPQEGDG